MTRVEQNLVNQPKVTITTITPDDVSDEKNMLKVEDVYVQEEKKDE